jgi:hypothetical protein
MTTANEDRSNTHALPMCRTIGDSSNSSSSHLWTMGADPQQEQRREPSPQCPPAHHRVSNDYDVRDTIEVRHHAQA